MKNIILNCSFTVLILVFASACATQKKVGSSTIIGGEYHEESNSTEYFVVPGGKVNIPGRWKKTTYVANSKQQFFTNIDSLTLAISFTQANKYEFNLDGTKQGFAFIDAFYTWESNFMEEQGLSMEVIESNREQNFQIYRLFGDIEKGTFDTFFLVGEKMGNVSNFSMTNDKKWTENQIIDFLKQLFLSDEF